MLLKNLCPLILEPKLISDLPVYMCYKKTYIYFVFLWYITTYSRFIKQQFYQIIKNKIEVMSQQKIKTNFPEGKEIATLGGGCFWCIEAVFNELKGVEKVESGYSGGIIQNPTYEQICTGTTGHAEVIHFTFDPKTISFKGILQIFFSIHDPTSLNRQGADIGTQYRSVIFYHNNKQKTIAKQVIAEFTMAKIFNKPIVTQVEPFKKFYKAEKYHQEYFKKNPQQPYCKFIVAPKVVKLRENYKKKLKMF